MASALVSAAAFLLLACGALLVEGESCGGGKGTCAPSCQGAEIPSARADCHRGTRCCTTVVVAPSVPLPPIGGRAPARSSAYFGLTSTGPHPPPKPRVPSPDLDSSGSFHLDDEPALKRSDSLSSDGSFHLSEPRQPTPSPGSPTHFTRSSMAARGSFDSSPISSGSSSRASSSLGVDETLAAQLADPNYEPSDPWATRQPSSTPSGGSRYSRPSSASSVSGVATGSTYRSSQARIAHAFGLDSRNTDTPTSARSPSPEVDEELAAQLADSNYDFPDIWASPRPVTEVVTQVRSRRPSSARGFWSNSPLTNDEPSASLSSGTSALPSSSSLGQGTLLPSLVAQSLRPDVLMTAGKSGSFIGLETELSGQSIVFACAPGASEATPQCRNAVGYGQEIAISDSTVVIQEGGTELPRFQIVIDHADRSSPPYSSGEIEMVTSPIPLHDATSMKHAQKAMHHLMNALFAPSPAPASTTTTTSGGRSGGGTSSSSSSSSASAAAAASKERRIGKVPLERLLERYEALLLADTSLPAAVAQKYVLKPAKRKDGLQWFVKLPLQPEDVKPMTQVNYGVPMSAFGLPKYLDLFHEKRKRELFATYQAMAADLVKTTFAQLGGGDRANMHGLWTVFLYNLHHLLSNKFRAGSSEGGHGKDELDQLVKSSPTDAVRLLSPAAKEALMDAPFEQMCSVCPKIFKLKENIDLYNQKKLREDLMIYCQYAVLSVFRPHEELAARYPGESRSAFGSGIVPYEAWDSDYRQSFVAKDIVPYIDPKGDIMCVVESRHTRSVLNQGLQPGVDQANLSHQSAIKILEELNILGSTANKLDSLVPIDRRRKLTGTGGM